MRNSSVSKRPGRPPDPRARAAILDATLVVVGEHGVPGATLDAIAARAGVSKNSIYRRWSSKEELIVDALAAIAVPLPDVVPGDARTLIGQIASVWIGLAEEPVLRAFAAQIFAEGARDPRLLAAYEERIARPRRERVRQLLDRARVDGQLRADLELDVVADLLIGPAFYRMLNAGGEPPFREGYLEALVRTLATGIFKEGV